MALPLLDWVLAKTKWKSEIDPILANPTNSISILKNVKLVTGTNVINHNLGQVMQGWFITDQMVPSSIVRSQTAAFNDKTLTLIVTVAATVNIAVF
jgi:hypothetical protein